MSKRVPIAIAVLLVAGTAAAVIALRPGDAAGDGARLGVVASGSPTAAASPTAVASPDPTPRPTQVPIPGHEVYGFVPYWEMDAGIADHLAATDLTTLALFSVTHTRDGSLASGENGYERITGPVGRQLIREAHERGSRVELVYTSFGTRKNAQFFDRPEVQERTIAELVAFAQEIGVDGINVDVESLDAADIPAYGQFVGRLREALRAAMPEGQVSVATTANQRGAVMAAAASLAEADRIFVMGYDYHWAGSDPGASAPLRRRDGDEKDLRWTLDLYHALGVPVERTILGLPLYGMVWPVTDPELGAPQTGRGATWEPSENVALLADPSSVPIYDPIESVEFLALPLGDGWEAVYYDSPDSLTPKLALADERGLAGAGFWAIGYERGLGDYTDLIATFRAGEIATRLGEMTP